MYLGSFYALTNDQKSESFPDNLSERKAAGGPQDEPPSIQEENTKRKRLRLDYLHSVLLECFVFHLFEWIW